MYIFSSSSLYSPFIYFLTFFFFFFGLSLQMSGINGLLCYGPQILEQAGVSVLLSNMGLESTSASLLLSAFTTLFMLPCIVVAMRLMDVAGRR